MAQTMIREDVLDAIRAVVEDAGLPGGVRVIDVQPDEDHDGDPVIRVWVGYDSPDDLDIHRMSKLSSRMWGQLHDLGEERFPHVRFQRIEPQQVAA